VPGRDDMVIGLLMQALGLACVVVIAHQHVGFAELSVPLVVAGTGTSLVFPTAANEVVASVAVDEIGVASGTNSALRELGGVFGVAVLASVFTRPGVYTSASTFVAGFRSALWVGAAFSAIGILVALSVKRVPRRTPEAGPTDVQTQTPSAVPELDRVLELTDRACAGLSVPSWLLKGTRDQRRWG
jgi:hypothetical protein